MVQALLLSRHNPSFAVPAALFRRRWISVCMRWFNTSPRSSSGASTALGGAPRGLGLWDPGGSLRSCSSPSAIGMTIAAKSLVWPTSIFARGQHRRIWSDHGLRVSFCCSARAGRCVIAADISRAHMSRHLYTPVPHPDLRLEIRAAANAVRLLSPYARIQQ